MTKKQKKILYRIITASILLVAVNLFPVTGYCKGLLFLIPYFVIGYDILRKAALGILKGKVFDENFLMTVATVGAMILGEYSEGVAVMLLYQIGELFQSVAVGKSRRNIAALMDIRPDYANVEDEFGKLEQVDPEEVEIGTIIVVRPGEKMPLDGVVVEGNSTLNTSALTGESIPKEVHTGEKIISGCINGNGLLRIRTTKKFEESTASKILELVENSSMKKSHCENFITKFARYYTPMVFYCALVLAILPPVIQLLLGNPGDWRNWIVRALTFLVISCPCALVVSIPLSFFGGIGAASACGILVKGSNYLEALARTRQVVFDKTGTLTQGVFQVVEMMPENSYSEECLLRYAAYAESYSSHPISKSLREAYEQRIGTEMTAESISVTDIEEISGHGVSASVNGVLVATGNTKLMKQLNIPCAEDNGIGTIVHVAVQNTYAGYILISDVEKETAASAVTALKRLGVHKTIMLTGDRKAVAEHVGKRLGVDEVHSELLPADKVECVEQLLSQKNKGEMLVFVGDGINDAPVLSRADIGIAMGALGSDAAIEAADIVLMDDNPEKIALAIRISRKCIRIVYQNIIFALGVKGLCLLFAVFGIANMWMTIFADVGVMVLAVFNAIRCLNVKKK